MKTVILPGYSAKNKEWAEEIANSLKLKTDSEVLVHEWRHWTSGSFNLNYEIEEIIKKFGKDKVNIVAKSIGTSVAMDLIGKLGGQIEKIILCGIPARSFGEEKKDFFKNALSKFSAEKIICFQNEKDPLGNFALVEKFIHSINSKIKVVKKERSDHHYPYSEEFQKFLF